MTSKKLLRRDALKAVAMLAAPLVGQTVAARRDSAGGRRSIVPAKRDQPFDDGWRFLRADAPGAERLRQIGHVGNG